MPFAATWMDLETVIQSEVSQKKKDKYNVAYMWNQKKCYKWTYLQNRSRVIDVENKLTVTSRVRNKLGDWN